MVTQGLSLDLCSPYNVLSESVTAIDIHSGLIYWANQLSPVDAFTTACDSGVTSSDKQNCPYTLGLVADSGMAPTFFPRSVGTPYGKDTVVVG